MSTKQKSKADPLALCRTISRQVWDGSWDGIKYAADYIDELSKTNWEALVHPATGKTPDTIAELLSWDHPPGAGLTGQNDAPNVEWLVTELRTRGFKTVAELVGDVKRKAGRPKAPESGGCEMGRRLPITRRGKTNTKRVLAARLQEDHPKIWKEYREGTHRSITAAAIAAGIAKDQHQPLKRLREFWNKATEEERETFKRWQRQAARNGGKIESDWK